MTDNKDSVDFTDAVPLFPTFVWKVQLNAEARQRINRDVLRAIGRQTASLPALAPGAKFQTDQTQHRLEEFAELCGIAVDAATGALEFLKLIHTPLAVTGCWANISAPGATHKPHTHPNNFLSGVYYVQADEGAQQIYFDDPRPQTNVMSPRTREVTPENAGQIHLGVNAGMLILFPSWLQHSVPENRSGRERVSIAINLMFSDFERQMAPPKWEGNVPVT